MFCTKCGAQFKETQRFCVQCGTQIPVQTSQVLTKSQNPTLSATLDHPAMTAESQRQAETSPLPKRSAVQDVPQRHVTDRTSPGRTTLLWAGMIVVVVVAGVFLGYRWLDHKPAQTQSTTVEGDSVGNTLPIVDRPAIAQAIIRPGQTSLQLTSGKIYLYGFVTGTGLPSGPFEAGQYAQAVASSGNLGSALSYSTTEHNQFSTSTYSHAIGGVSVSGQWDSFQALSGSNAQPGVSNASVSFTTIRDSFVVFIGLSGGQEQLSLQGIPGMEIDASCSSAQRVPPIVIAHANLPPGSYTIIGLSSVTMPAPSDYINPKADLIGVFLFSVKHMKASTAAQQNRVNKTADGLTSSLGNPFVPSETIEA